MVSRDDRIKEIEEEIQKTPYNKATQHHIGKLKAKIAQLREAAESAGGKGKGYGFGVRKTGDATVVLVGYPSVGKSTLLNSLTNAESAVAAYEFTTVTVIPGMMEYEGVKIQLLDLPGIISGASGGKGRGREVLSIARNADLALINVDVRRPEHVVPLKKEVYNAGIRLDVSPPKMSLYKKMRGGVEVTSTVPLTRLNDETVREILNVYGVHNADVVFHEDMTDDRLIDGIMGNRSFMPSLTVLTKADLVSPAEAEAAVKKAKALGGGAVVAVSAEAEKNLDYLKKMIYERLDVIRIYMRPQGGEADYNEPLIIRRGSTIGDVCDRLHKDFRKKFKYAQVWGKSAKHPGQRKGFEHMLADSDVLTIIKEL
ncbi:Fe(2+) transporter FeoB [uncultured archaeon]|nr:Fe(2+) transporter FeoB [uncultured archaeon]